MSLFIVPLSCCEKINYFKINIITKLIVKEELVCLVIIIIIINDNNNYLFAGRQ